MVFEGGFSLHLISSSLGVLPERAIDGHHYCEGIPNTSFEVIVRNMNAATYKMKVFVDGKEADPGYSMKLYGVSERPVRGFVRKGGGIHKFLFSKTPVDLAAPVGAAASTTEIGVVRVEIYATRAITLSESEDECDLGHGTNDALLGCSVLPERLAVKELGVQAQAGEQIASVDSRRRRRRGDTHFQTIKPAAVTLVLHFRDSFWFETNRNRVASTAAATRRTNEGGDGAAATKRVKIENNRNRVASMAAAAPQAARQTQTGDGGAATRQMKLEPQATVPDALALSTIGPWQALGAALDLEMRVVKKEVEVIDLT